MRESGGARAEARRRRRENGGARAEARERETALAAEIARRRAVAALSVEVGGANRTKADGGTAHKDGEEEIIELHWDESFFQEIRKLGECDQAELDKLTNFEKELQQAKETLATRSVEMAKRTTEALEIQ